MSDTSSINSGAPNSLQLISPSNQLVTVKLDDHNFLVWKQQVHMAIRGYGLDGYIDETNKAPEKFLPTVPVTTNPDFITWQRQDHLFGSWILSSLSSNILPLMVGHNTSMEIWTALEKNFSSQSLARVMQYKIEIQALKKGSLSMKEYMMKTRPR
ncbi:Unknown protein [Striga hermonthica]|uniref:Retrotransposon Copia-like N-terminal domain-containing protein n=1 Tax=Striga hermonthica TaxID=68872 RepID=A0A9N7NBJ3_STRHE|nr:Unknown protein [Striga hermonthica]